MAMASWERTFRLLYIAEKVTPSSVRTGIQRAHVHEWWKKSQIAKNDFHETKEPYKSLFCERTTIMQLACSKLAVASVSRYGEASKELLPCTCTGLYNIEHALMSIRLDSQSDQPAHTLHALAMKISRLELKLKLKLKLWLRFRL
jgi:hypothetical protein